MTWRNYLKPAERLELERAEKAKADAQALRRKLQSRCQARMRREKENQRPKEPKE